MRGRASPPDERPLCGRTVVVCRAEDEVARLASRLQALGAETLSVPLHRLARPVDGGAALAAAVGQLARYRWLVVTSANGVRAIEPHLTVPVPELTSVAAVGPATAAAFTDAGIPVDLVPATATAKGLVAAIPPAATGERVLAPLNAAAASTLVDGLEAKGYTVDRVDAYRMVRLQPAPSVAADIGRADAVLFTAPSQVEAFVDRFGSETAPPVVACIGPSTSAAALERGLNPIDPPAEHNVTSLIDALLASLREEAEPERSRASGRSSAQSSPEKGNP